MKKYLLLPFFLLLLLPATASAQQANRPAKEFIEKALTLNPEAREAFILEWISAYGMPTFMSERARIDVQTTDQEGRLINAHYFVLPDYLCVGTDDDFLRIPMQPKTAQRIADSLGYFLSTRKICNDVYQQSIVKLEPHPLMVDRDSLYTFIEHNGIIEGQRMGKVGLIAGHKKDVIITHRVADDTRPDRLALYGWHKLDGTPIQNIYTGHVDWYVDYSHGFRLVDRTIYVEGVPMDYVEVMKHPVYSKLICDEERCDFYAYPTKR